MQTIAQTGTSSVVFRLNKVATQQNVGYNFKLVNQNDKSSLTFSCPDSSPSPGFYQVFDWVNGVTYSGTQGRFDIGPGNYFLYIYEYNTATFSGDYLIYDGEIKVSGTVSSPDVTYNSPSNIKYYS